MTLKHLLVSCLLTTVCFNTFSQEGLYIDENMKLIDSMTYVNKCNSIGYKCLEYQSDSISFSKVLYKYEFGKLDAKSNRNIRAFLSSDSKRTFKTNDILLIKYVDTLYNFSSRQKQNLKHVKMHHNIDTLQSGKITKNTIHHSKYTERTYLKNIRRFSKTQAKCQKKFEKQEHIEVFHVFNHDQKVSSLYPDIVWVEDKDVLKPTFFSIVYNYNFLILKPDGSYFLSGYHLSDKMVKTFIKTLDWSDFEADWKATLDTYVMNGKGIFEVNHNELHKEHCF